MDFHPYHGRSGWLKELERLITDLRRDNLPPGRISVLLLKTPRGDEEKHLERMGLRRLSEDDVPHLGSASVQTVTWSIVSGFKGLENDVVILAALTNLHALQPGPVTATKPFTSLEYGIRRLPPRSWRTDHPVERARGAK